MYCIKRLVVGPAGNCTYIVFDEKKSAVIIDPAWEWDEIVQFINDNELELKAVFLTHYHYDHTNLASSLVEKYNCNVYISEEEMVFYQFQCANLIRISDGDKIRIGTMDFSSILTPGHTVGSICYKLDSNLFTGDTLFIRSCGVSNCKGGNTEQLFYSIKHIKQLLKEEGAALYPGHLFENDLRYEKEFFKRNIYLHIEVVGMFEKLIGLNNDRNAFLKKYEM